MQQVRARLSKYTDLRTSVRNLPSFNIGGGNWDINFNIRGPELEELAAFGEALRVRSQQLGIIDADITLKLDRPELRVVIDRVIPLSEAQAGHEYMETNANFGKIVVEP